MRLRGPGILLLTWPTVLLCSCGPGGDAPYARLHDPDPEERLAGIRRAVRREDHRAVALLIDRLGDPEPDVRLFAHLALKRITGKNFGYRPWAPSPRRAAAVDRWRAWLASTRGAAAPEESAP